MPLTLDDWDRCGRDVPTIVNLMPSGKYLMEEFFYAGGLPVVIKRLGEAGLLNRDALTVSGETAWDQVKDVVNHNEDVILPADKALTQSGGIVVVKGNLAPDGAVLKPSAATPSGCAPGVKRRRPCKCRAASPCNKCSTAPGRRRSIAGITVVTPAARFASVKIGSVARSTSPGWSARCGASTQYCSTRKPCVRTAAFGAPVLPLVNRT